MKEEEVGGDVQTQTVVEPEKGHDDGVEASDSEARVCEGVHVRRGEALYK